MTDAAARTRHWLERAVIGLNLCPFAKAVLVKEQVRFVVSTARTAQALQADLCDELRLLAAADPEAIDTTLLIHPQVLNEFAAFNDFLDVADAALVALELEGVLQIASFHPHYQFAGTAPQDAENLTNRAPYPTLHLLREASIARAVAAFPDAGAIYQRNIDTVQRLGHAGWRELMDAP